MSAQIIADFVVCSMFTIPIALCLIAFAHMEDEIKNGKNDEH